jgi:ABC-type nitrate/sulfonate/bicarbonate transport system substrate-binding protein
MLKGDTYAAILNPPFNAQALAAGMRPFGDQHDILPQYPGSVIAVRREWAQTHRNELVAYLRAWRQAGEFAQGEPEQAARLFAADADLPTGTAAGLLPVAFNSGRLNLAGLQSVLDLRTQFGYALPMGADLPVFVDDSFWSAAAISK